jgi:hypothetical protein
LLAKIEYMLGAAPRAMGGDDADDMPVAVAHLNVDPPRRVIRGEQNGRRLTMTLPTRDGFLLKYGERRRSLMHGIRAPFDHEMRIE